MRRLKKSAKITSNDGKGNSLEIAMQFSSTNQLEEDEVDNVVVKASRQIADALRTLPYTDFGPENTKISI